jgi:hypothetical protein
MKRKGKEYFGAPKWFARRLQGNGNGSLLNVGNCRHYIGRGFDKKKHTWTDGVFLTDFEVNLPFWQRYIAEADFIIHFRRLYDSV